MFRRVLVALDRAPDTGTILETLGGVLAPEPEVHLLHVTQALPVGPAALTESICRDALGYLEGLAPRVPPGRVSCHVRGGSAVEQIARAALELNVDLVAAGTRGRPHLFTQGMGEAVARRTGRPVLVARAGAPARPIRRILVPLAEPAHRILDLVRRIATAHRAEVVVMHVEPPVLVMVGEASLPAAVPIRPDPEYSRVAASLRDHGLAARCVLAEGDVSREILAEARDMDVDLIALTVRARGLLDRLFMGSVTAAVRRRAPCPLLLWAPREG